MSRGQTPGHVPSLEQVVLLGDLGLPPDELADPGQIGELVARRDETEAFLRLVRDPVLVVARERSSATLVFESPRFQIRMRTRLNWTAAASRSPP